MIWHLYCMYEKFVLECVSTVRMYYLQYRPLSCKGWQLASGRHRWIWKGNSGSLTRLTWPLCPCFRTPGPINCMLSTLLSLSSALFSFWIVPARRCSDSITKGAAVKVPSQAGLRCSSIPYLDKLSPYFVTTTTWNWACTSKWRTATSSFQSSPFQSQSMTTV